MPTELRVVDGPKEALEAAKEILMVRFPDGDPESLVHAREILAMVIMEYVSYTVTKDPSGLPTLMAMILERLHVSIGQAPVAAGEPN